MNTVKTMLMLLLALTLFALTGCGGSGGEVAIDNTTPCPDWFVRPPADPDYLFAAATAESRGLQLAMDKAKVQARNELAAQLETHIQSLTTNFTEEVGLAEEADILAKFNQAIKQVVDQTMCGSRVRESSQQQTGDIWRACVLMEVPIGAAQADLLGKISADREMYTRFRSSQAFQQLEAEVQKQRDYEASRGR